MVRTAKKAAKVKTRISTTTRSHFKISSKINSAFTMIELMVVIIIVAMIATVSSGYFVGTYKKAQIRKACRELAVMAKFSRVAAIEKQVQVKLCLDRALNEFYVKYYQRDEHGEGDFEEVVASGPYCRRVVLPLGIVFERVEIFQGQESEIFSWDAADDQEVIHFYPDGRCDRSVVQIGDGKRAFSLKLEAATGSVEVVEGVVENFENGVVDLDAEGEV